MPIVVTVVGVISGFVSAACWFWSAWLETPLPLAYLSSPPPGVITRIRTQSRLNQAAAFLAGVTMACQGLMLFIGPK
jgi:hypothetical protein